MVKFEHPTAGYPTTGSGFIRKWKSSNHINGKGMEGGDSESKNSASDVEWCEPPQKSFPVEFCQDTSLHGLKYIGQPHRHLSERIFWFLMFVISLSVAVWLISAMWDKYIQNPVIVSFQPFETNVDQVPFPAVTVCNMNKVMRTKAEEYKRGAQAGDAQAFQDMYYLEHVCTSTQSFSRRFNFTHNNLLNDEDRWSYRFNDTAHTENLTRVNRFLRRAAQNCSEMIPLCVWHDQELDCNEIFRPIETEHGKCCTFNMIPLSLLYTKRNDTRETSEEIRQWKKWDIDQDGLLLQTSIDELQYPRRQMKAGLTNGLSFLLNVNSNEYYCTSSDSIGFRMATHLPLELPKVADFGISLRPESEIFVDVVPQITMVDKSVFAYSMEKRNCYKNGEYKLTYFKYYSINNCIDECIANDTKKECDCKRFSMPRNEKEPLCGPHKFECAENVRYNKTKNGIRNTCAMCFQSCTEVNYESQTTATSLRKGIWKFANGTGVNWNEKDLSIVHVYIGQDSFYAKVRKELYGQTDLFANTGGLMGLCLGFSGLSLVEVIYFLTLRAWWKRKRKQIFVKDEEHSNPKWARSRNLTPATSPLTSLRRKIKSIDQEKKQTISTPAATYYRSIFGEMHVKENN